MVGSARPHRVAVLVFEHPSLFEMAVPCEVWGIDRTAVGVPPSEVRVCTPDPSPLHTDVGYTVTAPYGLEALRWADTVVVPAAPKPSGQRLAPEAALAALRAAHRRGARIASLCSGAFTLADAGLLDGRRATTHWMYTDDFRRGSPIDVDPGVLYVGDGQVWTSAGTAAAIDLCLHFVGWTTAPRWPTWSPGAWWSRPTATAARRSTSRPRCAESCDERPRRHARLGGGPPRRGARRRGSGPPGQHVAADVRPPVQAGPTGTTPLQWLLTQRVVLAQRLLEATDLPIEVVARQAGFGSAATLRQHFARVVGTRRSRTGRASAAPAESGRVAAVRGRMDGPGT